MTERDLIASKPPECRAAYWQTVAEERITPGMADVCIVVAWVLGIVFGLFLNFREGF